MNAQNVKRIILHISVFFEMNINYTNSLKITQLSSTNISVRLPELAFGVVIWLKIFKILNEDV